MKRLIILFVVSAMLLMSAAFASAQNGAIPPGGTFYAGDVQFRSVITPTAIPDRGKFDTLYVFPDCADCAPVSDAAPGIGDYNGGRWKVVQAFGIRHQLTNADDVVTYASNLIETNIRFVCPLVRA